MSVQSNRRPAPQNRRAFRWRQRNRIRFLSAVIGGNITVQPEQALNGYPVGWLLRWEPSTEVVYWQASSEKEALARLGNRPEENRPA